MDPFEDDSSSTNEEIQRLWDKIEGLQSSGALEKEEAAWERQQSSPMPFLETPNLPVAKYQSVDTDRNSHTSHNYTPLTSLQTQSSSSSSTSTTTTTTTTTAAAPLGATTTKEFVARRLLESTQDATQSQHQDSIDSSSSGDSCSDDSSSSSSSLSSSSSSSSSSSTDDDSETSSDESSFSRDRDVDPSSVVMPAKTVAPPKNRYSQNPRGKSLITSKKEHLVSASSSRQKLPSVPRTNHHLEQSHAASNMASPERAGASRATQVKNPYRSTSKPKSVLQESKMVDLSSQLETEQHVTSRDHDTSKKEQDDDPFPFFDEDTSSVEVLEKGEIAPFFLPNKENQNPKSVKETTQRTTRNTSSMPKQSRTVILEDNDDDSAQHSSLLSVTGKQEQDTNQKLNSSTSPDVVIQDYQPETERQPEIDPSLYAPPVYKEKPRPVLHQFTTQNRPIGSRPQIPISNLFPAPMNLLWQSKFEHFNHVQSEVANMVCHSDDNVVVSAPTGAGKTAIFEMGLARFITKDLQFHGPLKGGGTARLSKHRKVVYFAPSKALCEERYQDWSHRLSRLQLGIEVSMITGDVEKGHCYYDLANSHFILTTPEKWDSILRKWSENFFLLASVKLLMIDEVHLLGDPSRGCCLESILARMKTIQRAAQNVKITPSDLYSSNYSNTTPEAIAACVRIIAVSATLPNIQDVAEFLGANEAFTFDDSYRPVPLNTRVVGLGYIGKNEYRFWMNLDEQIPHLIARYSDGKPTLVFCHTKKETENLVQRLINNKFCNHGGPSAPAGTVQYCLDKGVAYHHAGMEASERRRVEQAFADRKIRCLCATSTLAVGVNLPAHLVIVKGTKTWRGGGSGYQEIDPRSLLQMMGRAGRPGLDTSGMAIIMTDNSSKSKFENMTRGLGAADSQLLPKLVDVVNTEISHRVITDLDGAMRWLKTTFLFACLKASPIRFGIDPKTQSIDGFLLNQCQQAIDLLCEVGLVGEHETLFPREACHIMSQSMVPFDAMKLIASLSFDATQCQILKTISDMKMLHFPVRRLEKKALNACHKSEVTRFKLEGPLSKVRIQDSSQKTFVLLQAYISKQDLESFTLRREMSNMADKAQHILLTAQEYSIKGSKHGQVALQCLKLRRSLQLCLWGVSSGVLNQIQDVGHKSTAQLKLNGIVSFAQAIASTEEEIEKAAGRPKPFGKRLRTVVSKILCEKLNMMAEIEYTRGSNIPAGVQCHLRSPNQAAVVSETEKAKVNYTLLAYTDQPGTMLFFQEGITSTGSYRFCCPRNFGKLFIHLVASVVGLDETCVLDGNSQVHTSTFRASSKVQTRNSKLSQKAKPQEKAKTTCHIRNANPKLRHIPKSTSKSRETFRVPTLKQHISNGSRQQGDAVNRSNPSTTLPFFTEEGVEKRAAITPQTQRTQMQKATAKGHPSLSPQSIPPVTGVVDCTETWAMTMGGFAQQSSTSQQTSFQSLNSARPAAYVSPLVHQMHPASKSIGPSKKRDHTGSWNQTKRKQQRSQQRAFASKKDNPFAYFQHDPNDAESFLAGLSTQSSVQSSIIPQAKLQELHRNNHSGVRPSYRSQPRRTFNRPPDRKRRNFGGRPQVSNQELLRMKAEESQAHVQAQQWRPNDVDVAIPQQVGTASMQRMGTQYHSEYQRHPEYAVEDSFSRPFGVYEFLPNEDQHLTNQSWPPEAPPAQITQPYSQPFRNDSSFGHSFGGQTAMSHHASFEPSPDSLYASQYQQQTQSFHLPMESTYGAHASQNVPMPTTEQDHRPVYDKQEFREVFY